MAIKTALTVLTAVGWLVSHSDAARAHPHAWIDFEATILADDAGMVHGIQVNWIFDDFYTAFIADEIVKSGNDPQQGLIEVGRTNLQNLREFNYFVELRAGGFAIEPLDVERFETGIENNRLWLNFMIRLAEPVDPTAQQFTYSFYDPTYYVEILHLEGHQPKIDGRADCRVVIDPPNPSPETTAFAFSLDQGAQAPVGLGQFFAETAELVCG